MTREEALKILKETDRVGVNIIKANDEESCEYNAKSYEALDMAIKALEQEPCEDAISRQAANDIVRHECGEWKGLAKEIVKQFNGLPPVTPQEPKTGHWIEGQTDNPNIHNILCSCCFEGYLSKGHANSQYTKEKFQWCPKCGAKMIESQESEDKE